MRKTGLIGVISLLIVSTFAVAFADMPGRHPYYLRALSDLRGARWMLEHRPGDPRVSAHEDMAIHEIDAAIGELTRAAIDDGKNIHDHPPMDAPGDRPGRLHRAAEFLRSVRADVDREEDDPAARGPQRRAAAHIDAALHQTDAAIHDIERGR